ncbi:hypothetical protein Tco_0916317 [Tanacetum coccineum]
MRELREDTFSGNKSDDAHELVERFLDIVSLFHIAGVSHDAVMLRLFPITLTGAVKIWVEKLTPRTMNTWDLLKQTFIQSKKVSNGSSDGIAAIANKLDSLGRDMKKLNVEEVKYGEFGRSFPNTSGNNARYIIGPPGYYTCVDNLPPFGKKTPNLEEQMNKYLEELTQRRADIEDWMKKLQESTNMNIRNQNASLKNLETQVEQLTKGYQSKFANEVPNSSIGQCKAIFGDNEALRDETSSNGTNELHGVSFIFDNNVQVFKKIDEGPSGVLPCQLPLKELSLGSFTLPCTIGSLNVYAMTDLDMSKKTPMGTVENVLVKIDKFVFPTDFVIIDMLGDPNETMILGEDRIMFDINENIHHPAIPVEKVYMANSVQEEESFNPLEINKVRNKKIDDTTRAKRYNEWFAENNKHYNYGNTSLPYLGDYTIAPGRITNPDDMRNLILSIQSYFLNSS